MASAWGVCSIWGFPVFWPQLLVSSGFDAKPWSATPQRQKINKGQAPLWLTSQKVVLGLAYYGRDFTET